MNTNLIESIQEDWAFVNRQINKLKGFDKKYYKYLPDVCWKTEATQAKELKVSRRQIRNEKAKLSKIGAVKIELSTNGKRSNPIHTIYKAYPINNTIRERAALSFSYSSDLLDSCYDTSIYELEDFTTFNIPNTSYMNWNMLQNYNSKELNSMSNAELAKIYMDAGFIVLPTNYPIFTSQGVACSCYRGLHCHSIGKHPKFKYKHITEENYFMYQKYYLAHFVANPQLNIGFKVSGYSVLDLDYQNGAEESFKKMKQTFDTTSLDNVMSVTTPNGMHLYVDNTCLKNTAGQIGEGLDIRSDGGFVMAPGSVHKSGKKYEWNTISDLGTIPSDWLYEAEDPESLIVVDKGLTGKGKKENVSLRLKEIKLPKILTPDYKILEGTRNCTLFKWACRERGRGADAELIYDIITTIRDTYCENSDDITDVELNSMANRVAATYPTNAQKLAE